MIRVPCLRVAGDWLFPMAGGAVPGKVDVGKRMALIDRSGHEVPGPVPVAQPAFAPDDSNPPTKIGKSSGIAAQQAIGSIGIGRRPFGVVVAPTETT